MHYKELPETATFLTYARTLYRLEDVLLQLGVEPAHEDEPIVDAVVRTLRAQHAELIRLRTRGAK